MRAESKPGDAAEFKSGAIRAGFELNQWTDSLSCEPNWTWPVKANRTEERPLSVDRLLPLFVSSLAVSSVRYFHRAVLELPGASPLWANSIGDASFLGKDTRPSQ